VPQVLGLTADQARVLLANSKLIVNEIEVFSNDIPAGSVIGLNISESPLPEGATVTLEISKGPKIVIMPNVEGETIAAAERLLESLGLRVLIDTNQLRSNYGIAKVTSQLPRAGSEVRVGDRVTIVSR
jgi:serine/threonine-protein kinase